MFYTSTFLTDKQTDQAWIQDFLQGGGVNDGRVQRAPKAPVPTGGSRVD